MIYFPETGKVLKYRVVKFPTKSVGETQTEEILNDDLSMSRVNRTSDIHMSETTNEMPDQQTEEPDESQAVSNLKPNENIIHPRRERKPPSYTK